MLTAYVNAAMRKARYEVLAENEGFYGRIDGLDGVWANAENLETCREELHDVLEEWIAWVFEWDTTFLRSRASR